MPKTRHSGGDLSTVERCLQNLLAIELWRAGMSQAAIQKTLGVSMSKVNGMLKGVKREVRVVVYQKE